jgi:predicted small secreted protein
MRSLTQQLLLILVILLASCGTTRRVGEPIDITSPSSEKQRKYEYYYLEAIRLEQQEKYEDAYYDQLVDEMLREEALDKLIAERFEYMNVRSCSCAI